MVSAVARKGRSGPACLPTSPLFQNPALTLDFVSDHDRLRLPGQALREHRSQAWRGRRHGRPPRYRARGHRRPSLPLPLDRPRDGDPGHPDGLHQPVDRADLAARHLPGHRPQPADAGQHRLPALDADGLHGRAGRAGGVARPGGRHVRPGEDLQPRLRRLHRLLHPPGRHLAHTGRRAPSG